jgi:hemoglobin/transferrin/lactoferrin receptor protein
VDSFRRTYNADGSLRSIELQGPVADAATYDLGGLFVQDELPLGERADLTLGVRQGLALVDAHKVRNPASGSRLSVDDDWSSTVGQARLSVGLDPDRHWNWFAGLGQAFRAPNLSDLTRFDAARSNEIETPAPNLDPEHYLSFETGIKGGARGWTSQVAFFHTWVRDLIVRKPTGAVVSALNEVTKKNAGDGYVEGVEADVACQATEEVTLSAAATWLTGSVDGYPTAATTRATEPVSRLMPPTARFGATYRPRFASGKWSLSADCTMANRQDDLPAADRADTQRIPPGGTPGYAVLGLSSSYTIREGVRLTVALENLLDKDYRIHGSGVNEPGRNLVVALDARF